ncbi:unnamed protein product [Mycena citricolor]|uniref:Uncharacterized protein n=1 Tax=Mycena citricolor TaxID=2018698 RepID=A0AAD2H104_9AGAR|nr:unnamed protein product [Mycena citricolor]
MAARAPGHCSRSPASHSAFPRTIALRLLALSLSSHNPRVHNNGPACRTIAPDIHRSPGRLDLEWRCHACVVFWHLTYESHLLNWKSSQRKRPTAVQRSATHAHAYGLAEHTAHVTRIGSLLVGGRGAAADLIDLEAAAGANDCYASGTPSLLCAHSANARPWREGEMRGMAWSGLARVLG